MRILAIEFGSWSLKAVEIESRFRRMEVLDFHEVRLPLEVSDTLATYKVATKKLFDRLPSNPEKTVTSLPTSQVSIRFFHLPVKQTKKVEQMYRFELEDTIPFKLDSTILEHQLVKTNDGTAVTAAIAPRSHVESYLKWLSDVGLDPDWLSFDGMGLVNLYLGKRNTEKKKKKTTDDKVKLLLDIGHTKTGFGVVQSGRLLHYRTLSWGGAHLTHSLASALGVSLEEAEKIKHEEIDVGVIPENITERQRTSLEACFNTFAPFFGDLNHSIVSFRSAHKVGLDEVLLTGGTACLKGIASLIEEKTRKPVTLFKPIEKPSGVDVPESTLWRFGEAYGQALVFERKSSLLFNFRKHELAKKTSLTEVGTFLKDKHVTRLLRYSGVLAVILFFHVNIASHFAEKEVKSARAEISKVFSQHFRSIPKKMRSNLIKNPKQLEAFLKKREKQLNQKLKMVSKKTTPMLSLVKEISQSFPSTTKVDVNSLSINDRSLKIEGVVYEGEVGKVNEYLNKSQYFSGLKLSQNGQRFTIQGQVKGN